MDDVDMTIFDGLDEWSRTGLVCKDRKKSEKDAINGGRGRTSKFNIDWIGDV
jgi:hypothetical protein